LHAHRGKKREEECDLSLLREGEKNPPLKGESSAFLFEDAKGKKEGKKTCNPHPHMIKKDLSALGRRECRSFFINSDLGREKKRNARSLYLEGRGFNKRSNSRSDSRQLSGKKRERGGAAQILYPAKESGKMNPEANGAASILEIPGGRERVASS